MPKPFNQAATDKGKAGESDFQLWLDRHGFGYVAVCQAEATFAGLFTGMVKRPDFLVVLDGLGLLAVDVKHRETDKKGRFYTLPLDAELRRALMFERVFRLPIWYAYRGPEADRWFWISALKAFEVGKERTNRHGTYLEIKLAEFACIRSGADFGQLYTHRLPGLRKLHAAAL